MSACGGVRVVGFVGVPLYCHRRWRENYMEVLIVLTCIWAGLGIYYFIQYLIDAYRDM